MKKQKTLKKFIIALASTFVLNVFTGCNVDSLIPDGESDEKNSVANEYTLTNTVINDFSDFQQLYQIFIENDFGTVNLNTNQEYVKTAGASAKLTIGYENKTLLLKPVLKQRLSSKTLGYDFNDFSKVKKLTAQFYNPSDEVRTVSMSISFSDGVTTSPLVYKLQKGWNELVYAIDRTLLSFQADLSKAAYLQFSFDSIANKSYDLYLDNISIIQTNTPVESIEMPIEKDEICYFEHNYQQSVFYFWTWSADRLSDIVDFGLTADPDVAKTGTSFYVTTKKGEMRWNYWYYLRICEPYLDVIDWQSLQPEDKIEVSVWLPDLADGFGMDIRTTLGDINLYDVVDPETGKVVIDPNTGGPKQESIIQGVESIVPKQWSTISVKVADMMMSAEKHGYTNEKTSLWDIFLGFSLHWGEFVDVEQKTYYFDDFRIVRATEEGGVE